MSDQQDLSMVEKGMTTAIGFQLAVARSVFGSLKGLIEVRSLIHEGKDRVESWKSNDARNTFHDVTIELGFAMELQSRVVAGLEKAIGEL